MYNPPNIIYIIHRGPVKRFGRHRGKKEAQEAIAAYYADSHRGAQNHCRTLLYDVRPPSARNELFQRRYY